MSNVYITGTSSGLGKYLHKYIPSISVDRDQINCPWTLERDIFESTIIICGWPNPKEIDEEVFRYKVYKICDFIGYLESKCIGCYNLIFISSIDIYGHNEDKHEDVKIKSSRNFNGRMKLLVEDLVLNSTNMNAKVLRLSSLLGPNMRPNTLTKIMGRESISLSKVSRLNFILYNDVLEVINHFINKPDKMGIYNIVANDVVTVERLIKTYKKPSSSLNYYYNCGIISNNKINNIVPKVCKSSLKNIRLFKKHYYGEWKNEKAKA